MTRKLLSATILAVALVCFVSCSSQPNDKEIVEFFTAGLTNKGLEPFDRLSSPSAFMWKGESDLFPDWEKEIQSMNINAINKNADLGKQRIVAIGYPLTEQVLYQAGLNAEYANDIERILKHIVEAASKKSGIKFKSEGGIYVGENDWIRITTGPHKEDKLCVVFEVINLTVEREEDYSGLWR